MELFELKDMLSKDPIKNKVLQDLTLERMRSLQREFFSDIDKSLKRSSELIIKNLIYDIHHGVRRGLQDPDKSFHIDWNIKIFPSDEAFAEFIENETISDAFKYHEIFNFGSFNEIGLREYELLNILSSPRNHELRIVQKIQKIIEDRFKIISYMEELPYHFPVDLIENFYNSLLRFHNPSNEQIRTLVTSTDQEESSRDIVSESYLKGIASYWIYRAVKYLGIVYPRHLNDLINNITELYNYASKVIVLKDNYYVIKKPKIHTIENTPLLHNENGMALEFEDGTGHYYRMGFYYPAWIFDDDRSKFKAKMILGLKNGTVRKDAIEEFGIDRFIEALDPEIIDEYYDYQLLLIKISRRKCEFLKMKNPSTGEVHFEGVEPGIRTVEEAINWRIGIKEFKNASFTS